MTGYTRFEPTGITFDYPSVDLNKKQVTARVLYKGKVLMKVVIDLEAGTVHKEGSVNEVAQLTTQHGINSMSEDTYIKIFKGQAEFFIQNGISNPKEYFEEQRKCN